MSTNVSELGIKNPVASAAFWDNIRKKMLIFKLWYNQWGFTGLFSSSGRESSWQRNESCAAEGQIFLWKTVNEILKKFAGLHAKCSKFLSTVCVFVNFSRCRRCVPRTSGISTTPGMWFSVVCIVDDWSILEFTSKRIFSIKVNEAYVFRSSAVALTVYCISHRELYCLFSFPPIDYVLIILCMYSLLPRESEDISSASVPPPGYFCLYVGLRMPLLSAQTKHHYVPKHTSMSGKKVPTRQKSSQYTSYLFGIWTFSSTSFSLPFVFYNYPLLFHIFSRPPSFHAPIYFGWGLWVRYAILRLEFWCLVPYQ